MGIGGIGTETRQGQGLGAADGTPEQGRDARAGREALTAPFTSASISAIFAKVPLMVAKAGGRAGPHAPAALQAPLQCAGARLAGSRDAVSREVRADAHGARRSPPSPPTPPCSARLSGVIEHAAAVTRALARAGLPERAEGRAQLGPTPPDLRSPVRSVRSVLAAKDLHLPPQY